MSKQAAIFPGQGAQLVGMGKDIAETFSVAAETFSHADEILGFGLTQLCYEGPADKLNATDIQQPAIFTTSVAIFRAAIDAGLFKQEDLAAMGGLSLGEYAALHLAGALPFEDALRLVYRRGQLMQQSADANDGGMVSIMGMDEAKVAELCEAVADRGKVAAANFNCKGQIVISGDASACEAAAAKAEDFDGKAIPLKVAGAFHSHQMKPAADEFKAALADANFAEPKIPVVANVDAEYHDGVDAIREKLYLQVFSPVRWQMCVEKLIADGVGQFWEVGPNKVLTGLMRKISRDVKTNNVSTAKNLTPKS